MLSHDFNSLRRKLSDDVAFFKSHCNDSTNREIMRRSYVRSLFAFIEGYMYGFKQVSLKISGKTSGIKLKPEEIIALKEIEVVVESNGELKERPKYTPAKNSLVLAFIAISKQHEADFTLNKGDNGWRCYCDSIKIRDRLMHPKSPQDLKISDSELQIVDTAHSWFSDQLRSLEGAIAIAAGSNA